MTPPSGLSLVVFLTVVAFAAAAVVVSAMWAAPAERRTRHGGIATGLVLLWLLVSSLPTALGWVTADNPLPGAPAVLIGMFLLVIGVVVSPAGRRISGAVPLWALIGVQGFRVPLEWVLHVWSQQGTAPVQMSWHGSNIDVVAGVVCLLCAPLASRSRAAAILSQVVGIGLLANVIRIALTSLPTPLQAYPDPLLLPFHLPTLWIATVCVGAAALFHGLTVRKLLGMA